MRSSIAVLTAAALLTAPALAGVVDPKSLVLTVADLPAGYETDTKGTFVFTNARFSGDVRANKKLAARSGRVTGYLATYDKRSGRQLQTIQSATHMFRSPEGARLVLAHFDAVQRKRNARRGPLLADGRERTATGEESWVYWSGYPSYYAMVTWRQSRFLGLVASWGIGKQRTLALARAQERRIAAALR